MAAITTDYLIIGGGIMGVCIAREIRHRHPGRSVTLVEKESSVGFHASGRNSGVLHAGFYYTADSLKAKFCRDGNHLMKEYIRTRGLPMNECGKLVVARSAEDLPQLDLLLARAQANSVDLQNVTEDEARAIEPRVKTYQRALFSPSTATADPGQVIAAMREDAIKEGITVLSSTKYESSEGNMVKTSAGTISAGYVINTAGLYADKVARDFGFCEAWRILPFKGLYLYSDEPEGALRTNVYPVPDLRNPFLGVHFTVTVDGHAKIGPTAIPAFWREQYVGLDRFDAGEFAEIVWRNCGLFLSAGFDFRRLAFEELQKYSRKHLVNLASELATDVRPEHYTKWGRPGIRAQLINTRTRKLEMDFVLEGDARSFHVLNAVSPAWTCSLPFAAYVCDHVERQAQSSN